MMKTVFVILLLVNSSIVFAVNREINSLLKELDRNITDKSVYIEKQQANIDSLKFVLQTSSKLGDKFHIAQELCFAYSIFMKDSSLVYASKMDYFAKKGKNAEHVIEAKIDYIRILCSMGFFKEANAMISTIDKTALSPKLRSEYLLGQVTIHNHQEKFASDPVSRQENRIIAQAYRDSLLKYNNIEPDIRYFLLAATLLHYEQYDSLIVLLDSILQHYEPYSRNAGILAYSLATAYQQKHDIDNAVKYFTISSIADIQNGVRANTSMRILANLMYEKGDVDRAYTYMKSALEDAIFCNARINTLEASEMYILIDKAFQEKERAKFIIITILLVAFLLLCVILFVFQIQIRKQKIKIEKINNALSYHLSEIEKINSELLDSSKIKEQYVGLYMDQYTNYISQMGSFKRRALRIAKEGDIDKVILFLDSMLNTEEELAEFYNNFDITILNLFPDFVSEFNALLTPENAITPSPGKLLTPELRIFALIRLGITDITKISHFLQYSMSTIYNYRTKMKNKAKGNRDEFESNVAKIGQKNI